MVIMIRVGRITYKNSHQMLILNFTYESVTYYMYIHLHVCDDIKASEETLN